MAEEWGQRNREAEVTNSGRVTRWVSVILPARFWHSFPCPHSFASIPGFRSIVVTQGRCPGLDDGTPLAFKPAARNPHSGNANGVPSFSPGLPQPRSGEGYPGFAFQNNHEPQRVPSVRTTQDLGRGIQPRWGCFDLLAGSQGSACPRKRALQPSRGARA